MEAVLDTLFSTLYVAMVVGVCYFAIFVLPEDRND
jgi:hypothetical protein